MRDLSASVAHPHLWRTRIRGTSTSVVYPHPNAPASAAYPHPRPIRIRGLSASERRRIGGMSASERRPHPCHIRIRSAIGARNHLFKSSERQAAHLTAGLLTRTHPNSPLKTACRVENYAQSMKALVRRPYATDSVRCAPHGARVAKLPRLSVSFVIIS